MSCINFLMLVGSNLGLSLSLNTLEKQFFEFREALLWVSKSVTGHCGTCCTHGWANGGWARKYLRSWKISGGGECRYGAIGEGAAAMLGDGRVRPVQGVSLCQRCAECR